MPPSKELEKDVAKIEFATDVLSKTSLLEVDKVTEKVPFSEPVEAKRYLLGMDMDENMDETIVVQSSDWIPVPVDVKNNVDARKYEPVVDVEEDQIKVEDFITPDVNLTHQTNLQTFRRQLQELLVVYSYQIPYENFIRVYQQRYARTLDLSSFGVESVNSLLAKVKDVAVIKDVRGNFFLTAV